MRMVLLLITNRNDDGGRRCDIGVEKPSTVARELHTSTRAVGVENVAQRKIKNFGAWSMDK